MPRLHCVAVLFCGVNPSEAWGLVLLSRDSFFSTLGLETQWACGLGHVLSGLSSVLPQKWALPLPEGQQVQMSTGDALSSEKYH